jgi:hypothetical protein
MFQPPPLLISQNILDSLQSTIAKEKQMDFIQMPMHVTNTTFVSEVWLLKLGVLTDYCSTRNLSIVIGHTMFTVQHRLPRHQL